MSDNCDEWDDEDDPEWITCTCCGGEGEVDAHEMDPINCSPGEFYNCPVCNGDGGWPTGIAD